MSTDQPHTRNRNTHHHTPRRNQASSHAVDAELDLNCNSDPNQNSRERKPSYVGLSCAVSGYSNYIRYSSPDGRRITPPAQIPVSSNPQTLNSVTMVLHQDANLRQTNGRLAANGTDVTDRAYYPASHTRKITHLGETTTIETVTKFYTSNPRKFNNGPRDASPNGSDSGAESGGSLTGLSTPNNNNNNHVNGGNLVQRQIERLYGGKIQSVRCRSSPESDTPSGDETNGVTSPINGENDRKSSGGFFAKRFGVSKPRDSNPASGESFLEEKARNGSNPLEFKPLKVPAVFRLLRPEFREQLKSNSCQIPTDQITPPKKPSRTSTAERIIPIQRVSPSSKDLAPTPRVVSPPAKEKKSDPVESPANGSAHSSIGRIIPIQRVSKTNLEIDLSKKPALPVKPQSSPTPTSRPSLIQNAPEMHSPTLVSNCVKNSPLNSPVVCKTGDDIREDFISARKNLEQDIQEAEIDAEIEKEAPSCPSLDEIPDYDHDQYETLGGVKERSFLGTIIEEDNESTASGSQLNLAASRNGGHSQSVMNQTHDVRPIEPELNPLAGIPPEVKDGHYFIKLLENEIFKFEEQVCEFEEDLNNPSLSEDIRDSLLAAIGKAKLLMAQKLAQFKGLCIKNITIKIEEDPFVPTLADLAGFWDMVYIQVEHIHELFAELAIIRENGWKRPENLESAISPHSNRTTPTSTNGTPKAKVRKTPTSGGKAKKSPQQSEAAKARDEARKKMLEERKKQMKAKQMQNQDGNPKNGELFVQF